MSALVRRVWLDLRHRRVHNLRVAPIAGRPGCFTTNPCPRCHQEHHA